MDTPIETTITASQVLALPSQALPGLRFAHPADQDDLEADAAWRACRMLAHGRRPEDEGLSSALLVTSSRWAGSRRVIP